MASVSPAPADLLPLAFEEAPSTTGGLAAMPAGEMGAQAAADGAGGVPDTTTVVEKFADGTAPEDTQDGGVGSHQLKRWNSVRAVGTRTATGEGEEPDGSIREGDRRGDRRRSATDKTRAGVNVTKFVGRLGQELHETYALFGHHVALRGERDEQRPKKAPEQKLPWYVMRPDTPFRRCWDISQAFILLYLAVMVPLRVGYDVAPKGVAFAVEFFVDCYFYVDIVFNFVTAIESSDGELISDMRLIRRSYLRSWFTIDLLACLPVDLAIHIQSGTFVCSWTSCEGKEVSSSASLVRIIRILRLTRLMKLLRLTRMRRLFERYQNDLFFLLPVLSILRHVFILMFLGHFFGCFFYYFSSPDYWTEGEKRLIEAGVKYEWIADMFGGTDTVLHGATEDDCIAPFMWRDDQCMSPYGLVDRYIASIYWAFTTMTTVGYGDISASTQGERIFAIVGMIAGGIVFSEIISNMSQVIAQLDSTRAKYKENIEHVQSFIRDNHLPPKTRVALLSFFRRQEVHSYDSKTLLQEVPVSLRKEILMHLYADLITKCPLLTGQDIDSAYITDVCDSLFPYNCTANTYVYNRGELGSDIFIMKRGLAFVLDVDSETQLGKLVSGDVFGESALISAMQNNFYFAMETVRRRENVKSITSCSLLRMTGKDVREVMKKHDVFRLKIDTIYRVNVVRFESRIMKGYTLVSNALMKRDSAAKLRKLGADVRKTCVNSAAQKHVGLMSWYNPEEALYGNRLQSDDLHHPAQVNPFENLELRDNVAALKKDISLLLGELRSYQNMREDYEILAKRRGMMWQQRRQQDTTQPTTPLASSSRGQQ